MLTRDFFSQLGLSDTEQKVFTELYKLGAQPASTVARHLLMERTTVYKLLTRLTKLNLVVKTEKNSTAHFHVPSVRILKNYIRIQQDKRQKLSEEYEAIEEIFASYDRQQKTYLPKIRLFDNVDGIKNLYEDMYDTLIHNHYITIKFFASNVFQEQTGHNPVYKDLMTDFFQKIKRQKITLDTFLGNGILIMEHVSRMSNVDIDTLLHLPASNAAINMFVVGSSLYIIIFRDIPFGLKIDSEDLVSSMHFLFENLKTQ